VFRQIDVTVGIYSRQSDQRITKFRDENKTIIRHTRVLLLYCSNY